MGHGMGPGYATAHSWCATDDAKRPMGKQGFWSQAAKRVPQSHRAPHRTARFSRRNIHQCTTPVLQAGTQCPTMPPAAHKENSHH